MFYRVYILYMSQPACLKSYKHYIGVFYYSRFNLHAEFIFSCRTRVQDTQSKTKSESEIQELFHLPITAHNSVICIEWGGKKKVEEGNFLSATTFLCSKFFAVM